MAIGAGIISSGAKRKEPPNAGGPESSADRMRKRIVEHDIGDFHSANEAIKFGNTLELIVSERLDSYKFRQNIGSSETSLAITKDFNGKTTLRTIFMELNGNDSAHAVCNIVSKAIADYNDVHSENISLINEIIRDKPKPHFIG